MFVCVHLCVCPYVEIIVHVHALMCVKYDGGQETIYKTIWSSLFSMFYWFEYFKKQYL